MAGAARNRWAAVGVQLHHAADILDKGSLVLTTNAVPLLLVQSR